MATCLNCAGRNARIVDTRTVYIAHPEDGRLCISVEGRRLSVCPPIPDGCGETRRQRILDDGPAEKGWIPFERDSNTTCCVEDVETAD